MYIIIKLLSYYYYLIIIFFPLHERRPLRRRALYDPIVVLNKTYIIIIIHTCIYAHIREYALIYIAHSLSVVTFY